MQDTVKSVEEYYAKMSRGRVGADSAENISARRLREEAGALMRSDRIRMHFVINKSRDCRDFAILPLFSRLASETQSAAENPAMPDSTWQIAEPANSASIGINTASVNSLVNDKNRLPCRECECVHVPECDRQGFAVEEIYGNTAGIAERDFIAIGEHSSIIKCNLVDNNYRLK
jgi:hypothetical protein